MAVTLGTITVLDGNANPITVQVLDQSGGASSSGPFTWGHIVIDGLAGVNRAQVTSANALKVDASGATVPVSGTLAVSSVGGVVSVSGSVNAAQSGTWTVQPGNTANTTPWLVNAGQTGTWTVQPGNTANTTAWLVGLNTTPLIANGNGVLLAPTSSAAAGIAAVVSTALETGHVLKASAGNLYGLEVTTTTVSGMVLIHNSTTVPAAGAVTPVKAYQLPAGSTLVVGWNPPLPLSTGISVSFTTATTPFTQTNSATAYFSGQVV